MKRNSNQPPKFCRATLVFPALDGQPAAIDAHEAARITVTSVRTVSRWRRTGQIPPTPLRLLQLHHAGQIVPDAWRARGARFRAGTLDIGAYAFHVSELDGYGVMLQALRDLQVIRARERAEQRASAAREPSLIILPGGRY